MHPKRVVCIVLIYIGYSLFLSLAKNDRNNYTQMDLLKLFGRFLAISYFIGSMLFIVGVYWYDYITKLQIKKLLKNRLKDHIINNSSNSESVNIYFLRNLIRIDLP